MDVFNLHIRTDPTHSNMHSKSVKPNTCPPTFSPSSRTSKLETLLQDPKIVENGSLPPPVPLQPTDVLLRTAKPMRRASAERKHRVLLASNRRVQDVLGRVYVFRGRFVRYGLKDLRYDVLQRGYLRCVSSRTETDQKLLDTRAQAVQAVKEEVQAEDVVKGVEDQEMQTDVVKEEVQAKDVVKGVQTDVVKEREEVKHGETCTKLSPVVQNSLRGEEGGVDSNKTAEGRQGGHPLTSPTGFRPASKSSPRYNQEGKQDVSESPVFSRSPAPQVFDTEASFLAPSALKLGGAPQLGVKRGTSKTAALFPPPSKTQSGTGGTGGWGSLPVSAAEGRRSACPVSTAATSWRGPEGVPTRW
eukprot:CAMPEP_0175102690 /NCGR_PEP_ID=MMETSP0086_2-20121207/8606_1 /TAXON_ID=136419 /ORGANISM="Unknown Unknown, Strain D1" /LENGTH=357 /DNA_ID=CAMNT_0016377587 /DNA_START=712 /DNA_END=1783 /DNA_ORIENTATION=+